jgi:hypothetical protein
MHPIDDQDLATVRGGFIEMLLPMLPGLIQGISGMMHKGTSAAPAPQPSDPRAAGASPLSESTSPGLSPGLSPDLSSARRHVSVTVGRL